MKKELAKAKRTAVIAGLVVFLLALVKGIAGLMTGSTALLADALHSATDLLAIGSCWFGLQLASKKPTQRFPYGFYRAETLGALVASAIILYLGATLCVKGIGSLRYVTVLTYPGIAMAVAGASVIVALVLSKWEKRTSIQTGSLSLGTIADEARMDSLSSALVFVSIITSSFRLPYIEGIVTILISTVVVAVGLKNSWSALLTIMDASVDPVLERDVTKILNDIPGVRRVEKLRARKSGPYYFVEGHIQVAASMDVKRSHALSHKAQRAVREKRPDVEGVILHIEPYQTGMRRVLVPVSSCEGLSAQVEAHFGRAPWFLLVTIDNQNIIETKTIKNPFVKKDTRAGLAVINRFVKEHQLDAVLVREIGEIAFYALRDHCTEIFLSREGIAEDTLRNYIEKILEYLTAPTHSSEKKMDQLDNNNSNLKTTIETRLAEVVDPGAGLDVVRMGLLKDLKVKNGTVSLTFRPSSPVCPMAFSLAPSIKNAIESLPGVSAVKMHVENFNRASELEKLLHENS
jgi:cation diffusion facilitator family transporter